MLSDYIVLLKENGFSDEEIKLIGSYYSKYSNVLTEYKDIVGDNLIPSKKFFLHNLKHYSYMLDTSVDNTVRKSYLNMNKYFTYPVIKALGSNFLMSKHVFEDRNVLLGKSGKDTGITLPNEPVIWTPNHHFKDDVLASILATKRPACMLFASIPHFYNSFDGILAYYVGVIILNRKSKESRKVVMDKMKKVLSYNRDLMAWPEGVWNKTPNKLMLNLWPGFYRVAKETGVSCVPMVHYISDTTQKDKSALIHTVIDNPIDFNNMHGMSEKACLEYYRDVMCTWYYLMMEKYGKSTRSEELSGYASQTEAWESHLSELLKNVDGYDFSIETSADYRNKDILNIDEVYESIAKLEINSSNRESVVDARKLVKDFKRNDFQRRF